MAGAQPGFCSMKQLSVLQPPPPPGWDARPSQAAECRRNPFIHLGGERQCGVKFLVYGNNTMAGTGPGATNVLTTTPQPDNKEGQLIVHW